MIIMIIITIIIMHSTITAINHYALHHYRHHHSSFVDGAMATYDLLQNDFGVMMINAYAGNVVAAALVLSAVPSLAVLLWVLMDPTALGINIDKWLGYEVVSLSHTKIKPVNNF